MVSFSTPQDAVTYAIQFAIAAHDGQFRKESCGELKLPYIVHPLDVMKQVCRLGIGDSNVWVAAVLHDVIEDTEYSEAALVGIFGQDVTDIVVELTFRDRRSDETPQAYQKEKSAHLADFVNKSVDALVIKVADRLCNVRDYEASDLKYAAKYFDRAEGLWSAFEKRRRDITDKYGKEVYDTIQNQIFCLTKEGLC